MNGDHNRRERGEISFVEELRRSYNLGQSLLEKLREKPHWAGPDNYEEDKLTDLIEENLSLFPAKLQPTIKAAKDNWQPYFVTDLSYYGDVCDVVADFLGGIEPENYDEVYVEDNADADADADASEWCGPDADVDTKDEIELAIRLCPRVFEHLEKRDSFKWMQNEAKAAPFVPFIRDMARERSEYPGAPPKKKRKVNIIAQLTNVHKKGGDLLQKLREAPDWYDPESDAERKQLMELIEWNVHKFPAKLRPVVRRATTAVIPNSRDRGVLHYYDIIVDSVMGFLRGYPLTGAENDDDSTGWHGPDIDVDTKDEIELAIRLCPRVFTFIGDPQACKFMRSRGTNIFEALASSEKALPFIPLLIDIHPAFQRHANIVSLSTTLLNNENDESLAILLRLREKGCIRKPDIRWIFWRFLWSKREIPRSVDFNQRKLRFLIADAVEKSNKKVLQTLVLEAAEDPHNPDGLYTLLRFDPSLFDVCRN